MSAPVVLQRTSGPTFVSCIPNATANTTLATANLTDPPPIPVAPGAHMLTEAPEAQIVRLRTAGQTWARIGEQLNLSHLTALRAYRRWVASSPSSVGRAIP